ncbi:MAG: flavodoxin family protein [Chitinispirillales bacterium]|jgi:multimeric flavodoxin WrbA|nr:flavodoxin family protein [Chitinispirillales bacterium]
MKVLLVNGSPRKNGCTYTALAEIAKVLKNESIEAEIYHIGSQAISGCTACGSCFETKRCQAGDEVNTFLEKAKAADGFVFGSPVYFASISGSLAAFLDRAFYVGRSTIFPYKPAAAVVSCRRGGATAALDCLNKYITISQMPLVASRYWNMVHGNKPDEVRQDLEGMQVMRYVGKNMAWILKSIEAGKKVGLTLPEQEPAARTNFIR